MEPAAAPYVPGRHSDTAYAVTRADVVLATVVRPYHREADTCGDLAEAIASALAALPKAA